MKPKNIGIVGCGTIGANLIDHIEKNLRSKVNKIIIYDADIQKANKIIEKYKDIVIAKSMKRLVDMVDFVIEAASSSIVPKIMKLVIAKRKDIMVMSVGGFLDHENMLMQARKKGIRLIIPSGAICGIDAVKSMKLAGIKKVTLTTRKAPRALKGAPYLIEKEIDVGKIEKETVVFEGNVRDAVKGFPKNINVAMLLALSGIGPKKTHVRIVASPEYNRNIHEVEVESSAGTIMTRASNVPSPDNPGTSFLAILSAISALEGYFDTVRIGT